MHKLYEVKERLCDEIEEIGDKGSWSMDDLMKIKYMSSSADHLNNLCESEYSGDYYMGGGMDHGRSYARGRTNARRDSMGRYSSRGYSRNYSGDMDEETKHDIKRLVEKLDSM